MLVKKKRIPQELLLLICFGAGLFCGGVIFEDDLPQYDADYVYVPIKKSWGPQIPDSLVFAVKRSKTVEPSCKVYGPIRVAELTSFGSLMVPYKELKNTALLSLLANRRELKLMNKDEEAYLPYCSSSPDRVIYGK